MRLNSRSIPRTDDRSISIAAACAVVGLMLIPQTASANCDPPVFADGYVTLSRTIAAASPISSEDQACLQVLGAAIKERRLIRSFTVVVRMADDDRTDGKGIKAANEIKNALIAAGAPKRKLSALAPAIGHQQSAGVTFVYRERQPRRIIAKIADMSGDATYGLQKSRLSSAQVGTTLRTKDYLETNANSRVVIDLADGSTVKVSPNTLLRFNRIDLTSSYQRRVHIDELRGSMVVAVKSHKEGTSFKTATRAAVAGVRGTQFRLTVESDDVSRIEALAGSVTFDNEQGKSTIEKGFGSRARVGAAPSAPHALLPPTRVKAPVEGSFDKPPTLSWVAVDGAVAYVVELASNAEFLRGLNDLKTDTASVTPDASFAPGRYFWRVSAVDDQGFIGMPSKIFVFEVKAPAPATPAASVTPTR